MDQGGQIMIDLTKRVENERHHADQFIEWVEASIYAIEKADYPACRIALDVARKHLDKAEANEKSGH